MIGCVFRARADSTLHIVNITFFLFIFLKLHQTLVGIIPSGHIVGKILGTRTCQDISLLRD